MAKAIMAEEVKPQEKKAFVSKPYSQEERIKKDEEELEQMARNEAVVHTTDEIVEHYRENVTDIQFEDQGLNASAERGEANLKSRTAGEKVSLNTQLNKGSSRYMLGNG